MKKTSICIAAFFIVVIILVSACLYWFHHSSSTKNPNDYLCSINYAVQIGYNICYLIIACAVLFIANNQLNKTREATTIQTLTGIANNLKCKEYFEKRKALAKFILDKKKDSNGKYVLRTRLDELSHILKLSEDEKKEIAVIKNNFEAVIYDFEILSYYHEKNIYNTEDIYELFSYEIQYYWLLINQLGYIHYLRENRLNGERDFYNKFHKLYKLSIKSEVKTKTRKRLKFNVCRSFKKHLIFVETKDLLIKKNKNIDIFLYEELGLV